MGKRKREKMGSEKPPKPTPQIDTALHNILGGTRSGRAVDLDRFIASTWEKKTMLFKPPSATRMRQLAALFDTATLWDSVKKAQQSDHPLKQGWDINLVRYKDGQRETLQDSEEGTCERWQQLYKEGWSLQVHQPQRFCEALTQLCSSLEQQLGCLVGSNAYLTPAGAQGLAPHHDDVEIFVLQTEGRKHWRLYAPLDGFALPSHSSNDFSYDVIGEPIMELTLEAGDVLYLPRGVIHAATTDNESASCHITISTYQQWSFATLAQHLLQTLSAGQTAEACLPIELRRGVPVGFLYEHGLQRDAEQIPTDSTEKRSSPGPGASSAAASLAEGLRKLADAVEKEPALLSLAADSMAVDFMASRLPPSAESLPDVGKAPTESSVVRCRGLGLFRMMPLPAQDAPEDTGEGWVKVMSCLHNEAASHMMSGHPACCEHESCDEDECGHELGSDNETTDADADDDDGDAAEEDGSEEEEDSDEESNDGAADLVFPASYSFAIAQLLATAEPDREGICVSDIKVPTMEDKLGLAFALWSEGVIYTVSDSKKD